MEMCEHRVKRCGVEDYLSGVETSVVEEYVKNNCYGEKEKCPIYSIMCRNQKMEDAIEKMLTGAAELTGVLLSDLAGESYRIRQHKAITSALKKFLK